MQQCTHLSLKRQAAAKPAPPTASKLAARALLVPAHAESCWVSPRDASTDTDRNRSASPSHGWPFPGVILVVMISALAQAAMAADPSEVSGGRSFFDNFSTLDRRRWTVSDGWANDPHQDCTWALSNVRRTSKSLSLVLNNRRSAERRFSCAELQTKDEYGYGTYEARMMPAAGSGIVSKFYSYAGPPHGGDSLSQRWASFEFVGKNTRSVRLAYFAAGRGSHGRNVELSFEPSKAMNDYAMEWSPQALRWFINGNLVHELPFSPADPVGKPGKVFISLHNGAGADQEAWLGRLEYAARPLSTTFEHVAFTERGMPCQFPTSVVCDRRQSSPDVK
jgi:endo-1,3-1,4-beta-glycanase ExoK